MIPYQWEVLNDRVDDAEPSHAVKNFRIAAGLEKEISMGSCSRTAMWQNGLRQ